MKKVAELDKYKYPMKCPYNEFNECFGVQCPFYYEQLQTVDYTTGEKKYVSHCKRAEKDYG